MHGAPSVLIFTVTAGLGQGLFVWLALAGLGVGTPHIASGWPPLMLAAGGVLCLVLLGIGLLASFFHLGHPERAWRAMAMWRTSWLSREVIVLPLTMAVICAWAWAQAFGVPEALVVAITGSADAAAARSVIRVLALFGIALCVLLWLCTAMIYACLRFLQEWAHWSTLLNFLLLGLASGAVLMALLARIGHPASAAFWSELGAGLTVLALVARAASMLRNAHLAPRSTLQSALGIRHPQIRQIAQGATGGSYNTREFFHGKAAATVRNARLWALFGGALLPVLLLAPTQNPWTAALAVLLQYSGLIAERWLFFADARHPQNLYYQRVA